MGVIPTELNYVAIGSRIRELRRAQNLSQAELGSQLGISATWVSRIEQGECKLALERVVQLSKLFHISVDQLLFDSQTAEIQKIYSSINRYLLSMNYEKLKKIDSIIQSFETSN